MRYMFIVTVFTCLLSAVAHAECPIVAPEYRDIPRADESGTVKVRDRFGNELAVRGFPACVFVPVNRLFKNSQCPTRTGFVEGHTPRANEPPWPPGITPMHFRCDQSMIPHRRVQR